MKPFPEVGDFITKGERRGVVARIVHDADGCPAAAIVRFGEKAWWPCVNCSICQLGDTEWFVTADHFTGEKFSLPEGSLVQ